MVQKLEFKGEKDEEISTASRNVGLWLKNCRPKMDQTRSPVKVELGEEHASVTRHHHP